jgi:tetratricopeptide (TPR) repeat protein
VVATEQLTPRTAQITAPMAAVPGRWAAARVSLAGLIVVGTLGLALYAAFSDGATGYGAQGWTQLGLAVLAACAAALGVARERVSSIPRPAAWGLGLLAAFALWSGISLAWSIAPANTWVELNRDISYVLVAGIGLVIGLTHPRAVERVAHLFLVVAVLVALYALGTKVIPGVHLNGVFDLNQTAVISRLEAPLGYWNALALLCVFAVPIALRLTVDTARHAGLRLAGLAAFYILLATIAFTYSRGAVLVLVISLIITLWLARDRLRSLLLVAMTGAAVTPPLLVAFSKHALTTNAIPLGPREHAGLIVLGILLGCLAALLVAGRALLVLEPRVGHSEWRSRRIGRVLGGACVLAVIIAIIAVAASHRGLGGTISNRWHHFTSVKAENVQNPNHLLSGNSANRWTWWKEAAGSWSDQPLRGWGAGSFAVTHLAYRTNALDVQQPHNMVLQFLSEDGLLGAVLVLGGYLLLLGAAAMALRRRALAGVSDTSRGLAAALLAGGVIYAIHGFYDWDWDIPGASLPAFLFIGVLAGVAGRRAGSADARRRVPGADRMATAVRAARGALGGAMPGRGHAVAVAGATLLACAVALSGLVPAAADSKATDALSAGGHELNHATAEAQLATNLNPLSDRGLLVAAQIADARGRLDQAHAYLRSAVAREPHDEAAWSQLANLNLHRHDVTGAVRAVERVLTLDPHNPGIKATVANLLLFQAPSNGSATAVGTPLPMVVAGR